MKIMVLGAGAIGGYFGARLQQAGADVTFLVRSRRAAQLAAHGLAVHSPFGNFEIAPYWLESGQIRQHYDLVLLTCKAYDLEGAIDAIIPAMGPSSHVLPLLNGLLHLDRLTQAFGAGCVLGGCCSIPVTLGPQGEVKHLAKMHRIAFGALPGTSADAAPKLERLRTFLSTTPVDAVLADNMMLEMWEKFVGVTTLAAMTCLMRAAVGDIVSSKEGVALMTEALAASSGTATAAGFPPREAAISGFRRMLLDASSSGMASMLRDLEGGHQTEGRHVVADMLRRAREAGVDPGPLRAAWCHLESHELREQREARRS